MKQVFNLMFLQSFAQWAFLGANAFLAFIFFAIDEPLHMRRGLPTWEKISHPIDALCVGITFALGYVASLQQSKTFFWAYCVSALLTIVISFKDELIHQELCDAKEQVVHAFMFALNGIIFTLGAFLILLNGHSWPFLLGFAMAILTALWQLFFWFVLFKPAGKS